MKKLLFITAIWCPTCLLMRPRFKEWIGNHPNWSFEELDYDDQQVQIRPYRIGTTLPVAIFIDQGIEVKRIIGEISSKKLLELIQDIA